MKKTKEASKNKASGKVATTSKKSVSASKAEVTDVKKREGIGAHSKARQKRVLIAALVLALLGIVGYLVKDKVVVAWVNGRPITRSEYVAQLESQGGEQVLDQLVTQKLIEAEADKQGLKVTLDDINARTAEIEQQLTAQQMSLDEALMAQGMTRADLNDQVRYQILIEKLSPPTASPSGEEVANFIETNKDLLPADASQEDLEEIARMQLSSSQGQIQSWLESLKEGAQIIYW